MTRSQILCSQTELLPNQQAFRRTQNEPTALNDNSFDTSLWRLGHQTSWAHTVYCLQPTVSDHTAPAPPSADSWHTHPRISDNRLR